MRSILLLSALLCGCGGSLFDGDKDDDGFKDSEDCGNDNPDVYPGAPEQCDGLDNDCDGEIDEDAIDMVEWWPDDDGDGWGQEVAAWEACDAPEDHVDTTGDCNDADPDVHPDMEEICSNDIDDNCDDSGMPCELDGEVELSRSSDSEFVPGPGDRRFGRSVAFADVDGDSHADVIIGVPGATGGGRVLVYESPPAGEVTEEAAAWLVAAEDGHDAGYRVASAGDMDGDGNDDILIGAVGASGAGGDGTGAAFVVRGPVLGAVSLVDADAAFYGQKAWDHLGPVAGAGDVNGDGYDDILLGAPDSGDTNGGEAALFLGPVSRVSTTAMADARITASGTNEFLGTSVTGPGDVNGDGLDDLLVGAPGNTSHGPSTGAAYLYLAPVSGSLTIAAADASLAGMDEQAYAGSAVAGAGDVDGDGRPDLLVGAPEIAEGTDHWGKAYLVLGTVTGDKDLEVAHEARFIDSEPETDLGSALDTAGDTNGDGHADVILGAPDKGVAYVVYGPLSGEIDMSEAGAELVPDSSADGVGYSVAGGWDVDEDGYDDVLVGAQSDGDGMVFLLYGGGR